MCGITKTCIHEAIVLSLIIISECVVIPPIASFTYRVVKQSDLKLLGYNDVKTIVCVN